MLETDGNFMHVFGVGMMNFQNLYLMIRNVGRKQNFSQNLSEIIVIIITTTTQLSMPYISKSNIHY